MNKIILGVLAAVIIIGGAFFIFSLDSNDNSSDVQNVPVAQNETTADVAESEEIPTPAGEYIDYSPEAVASAQGTKVLFFHASWCPTCQALDQNIKAGRVPDGVSIFNLDYDTEDELRSKYEVRTQHTLVQVDGAGNLIKSWYGSYTIDQIMDQVI